MFQFQQILNAKCLDLELNVLLQVDRNLDEKDDMMM